jgi:hypothetical protein
MYVVRFVGWFVGSYHGFGGGSSLPLQPRGSREKFTTTTYETPAVITQKNQDLNYTNTLLL